MLPRAPGQQRSGLGSTGQGGDGSGGSSSKSNGQKQDTVMVALALGPGFFFSWPGAHPSLGMFAVIYLSNKNLIFFFQDDQAWVSSFYPHNNLVKQG